MTYFFEFILGPLIVWLIFIFPQIYNTFFQKRLWKTFFLPPLYSSNLPRTERKKYLIYYHILMTLVILLYHLLRYIIDKDQNGNNINDLLIGVGFLKKFKDVEWSLNYNKMRFYK